MSRPDVGTDRLERRRSSARRPGKRIMLVELPALMKLLDMRRDSGFWHRIAGKDGHHVDALAVTDELRDLSAARKHNSSRCGKDRGA